MRNRGDPFAGILSTTIIAKGQPCPPAPPRRALLPHPALTGLPDPIRPLLLHLTVIRSVPPPRLLMPRLAMPVVASASPGPGLDSATTVFTSRYLSPPHFVGQCGLPHGPPVPRPEARPTARPTAQPTAQPAAQTTAQTAAQLSALPSFPRAGTFRPGNLRLGITASSLSRRSRR